MKTLLFLLVISVAGYFAPAGEYVCLPCGQDCDQVVHKSPGKCEICGMELVEKSTVKFQNIDLREMCNRIKANPDVVLLDVRSKEEFSGSPGHDSYGHFKNAININVTELNSRLNELSKYKSQEIIVYCSHSHRSPRASYLLGLNGFTNVKNMSGGVSTFSPNEECLSSAFVAHHK